MAWFAPWVILLRKLIPGTERYHELTITGAFRLILLSSKLRNSNEPSSGPYLLMAGKRMEVSAFLNADSGGVQ